MATTDLTAARVRELFDYKSDSGELVWRVTLRGAREGKRAGHIGFKGYRYVGIDGERHREHIVIWTWWTGSRPAEQIDHRDGVKDNNRIANLRPCSNAENAQNRAKRSDNRSGHTGVTWAAARGMWLAQIKVNGKNHNLGYFEDPADGGLAYLQAKQQMHLFQPTPRA